MQDEEDKFDADEETLTAPTRSSTGISSFTDFSAFSLPSPEKQEAEEDIKVQPERTTNPVPKMTPHVIKKARKPANPMK